MKTRGSYFILSTLLFFLAVPVAQAQILKKLGKKAEKAAERTVERRVEKETTKKTDQVLDSILEPGSGGEIPKRQEERNPAPGSTSNTGTTNDPASKLEVYSKYDFTPGEELIWYDNFSEDAIGDFPATWNTNGSGEIVNLSQVPGKWLQLSNSSVYIPEFPEELPENYTVEFDLATKGLDRQTSSTARLLVRLEGDNKLFRADNYAHASIPLAQYIDAGLRVQNRFNKETTVNNTINKDIRAEVMKPAHVAIAVQGKRFRLWLNERKLVDLPRFIEPGAISTLKFELTGLPGEKKDQYLFLSNLRIAETGNDIRSKLNKEGRFSTTGIYFESGSSTLRPASAGVLQTLSKVLLEDLGLRLRIVGHTDADGDENSNQELSHQRAEAVKNALVTQYNIDSIRLEVDGKGESEPVAPNDSAHEKAKNRRVEFIKL